MIVVGSSYWNVGIGREKGDVLKDEEGLKTMRVLGENMAWVIKKLKVKSKIKLTYTTAGPQDCRT
jgi:multimeric flavodoxin WrbA